MKRLLIALILLLLMTQTSEAITLGEGVIIKPNSTANGSYINNQTATMGTIIVNSTDVQFLNIGTNYQLVESINSSGGVLSILCPNQENCTLSQIAANIYLLFTNNITTPIAPSGGGGGCAYVPQTNVTCNATSVTSPTASELPSAVKYGLLTVSLIGLVRLAKSKRKKKADNKIEPIK